MAQGPPVPSYIFRGHASPVHALRFLTSNTFLASGDSDGWIIIWSLATKRPVAVWKGHDGGIMGFQEWQDHKLISHGRDHRLRVWQLRSEDYAGMSIQLPVDGADKEQSNQPWLLHSLSINALNYCAFSICEIDRTGLDSGVVPSGHEIFLAAPNGLDAGGIDIFHLPSEHRVCKMASEKGTQTGMVMAVSLFKHPTTNALTLAAGYESGQVCLFSRKSLSGQEWHWVKTMAAQPHSQPVLSLDVTPNGTHVLSSSADACIAKYNIESGTVDKKVDTKHAGQQGLQVRDDMKIFATAGWDKRIRVYSLKTMKELAVLKWHQEGCYATAFAKTIRNRHTSALPPQENALISTAVGILKQEQANKVQNVHWLAGGGKDGKISLWTIY